MRADEIVGSLPSIAPVAQETATAAKPAPALAENAPPPAAAPEPAVAPQAQITPAPPPPPSLAQMSQGPGVLKSGPGYSHPAHHDDRQRAPAVLRQRISWRAASRLSGAMIRSSARARASCASTARNLEFAGDAISAEDGCELHITNSRIAAHGVGVSAHAANVYIENSSIEGQTGAIAASDGAQVYAEASSIRGVNRGLTTESLHDLGGNVWN